MDREEAPLGRWPAGSEPPHAVALSDRTVSTRQATLRREGDGFWIEHFPLATNPTLVNGEPVAAAPLRDGDRVEVGESVLRVSLAGASPAEPPAARGAPARPDATVSVDVARRRRFGDDDTTDVHTVPRQPEECAAHLRVVGGLPSLGMARFALPEGESRVGRSAECEVHLPDRNVSRLHAVVECRDGRVELFHRSRTSTTEVNGELVADRRRLHPGDEIQLSGRVLLRLESGVERGLPPRRALVEVMEERARLEELLAGFEHDGSFVDVDVVDSYGMKADAPHASVVVSFERLRGWLRDVADEFNGRFLNSNGDEAMFFFPSADAAVDAATTILARLEAFNRERNLLERAFRLRVGVHTGRAAVDLQRGYAFSAVLDVAGHIQKAAVSGGLLISGETFRALAEERRGGFEKEGELERHRMALYRWRP